MSRQRFGRLMVPSVRSERGGGVSRAEKWEVRREVPVVRKRVLWQPGWVRQARRCVRWAWGRWEMWPEESGMPWVVRKMERA
jgi:hypothetical protein